MSLAEYVKSERQKRGLSAVDLERNSGGAISDSYVSRIESGQVTNVSPEKLDALAKMAVRNRNVGELGLSYMGGIYNKYQEDGLQLDEKRKVNVYAVDFNTTLPKLNTYINAEWAWVNVNVPDTYTEQFGRKQQGGFIDFVQPVFKKPLFGFDKSVINAALRLEYVDWNKGTFKSTGGNISDELFSIVPAVSWRPTAQTVIRLNYRYNWQKDILGNPPAKLAGFQFGVSTYF